MPDPASPPVVRERDAGQPDTPRLAQARRSPEQVPRALRAILRDALASRLDVALDIIDNADAAPKDRLDALNLLARYGLGFPQGGATEGEGGRVLGVLVLPALQAADPMPLDRALALRDRVLPSANVLEPSHGKLEQRRASASLRALRGSPANESEGAEADGLSAAPSARASDALQTTRGPRETEGGGEHEHPAPHEHALTPAPSASLPSLALEHGSTGGAQAGAEQDARAGQAGGGAACHPGVSGNGALRTPPTPHTPDGPRASPGPEEVRAYLASELPQRGRKGVMGGYGTHGQAEKWEVEE